VLRLVKLNDDRFGWNEKIDPGKLFRANEIVMPAMALKRLMDRTKLGTQAARLVIVKFAWEVQIVVPFNSTEPFG
jgi:hypothetical protein